jgi:endonuclease/exonuclease/phosphatase family metal-dependent hydrolase
LNLISKYLPDIIGTQEISTPWYNEFKEHLTNEYGIVGISRQGFVSPVPMNSDESNLILYKLSRFDVLEEKTFWLTDTIDVVSKYEESKYTRICTYALLLDKITNEKILVCNTHLAHEEDDGGRIKQANVLNSFLNDFINKNSKIKIILTGDFNTTINSASYQIVNRLLKDAKDESINLSKVDYTYHEYGNEQAYKTIDYCFYLNIKPVSYYIINDDFNGYVSDHYGILVEFINS